MQINSLLDNRLKKAVRYSYHHRGSTAPYPPDAQPEDRDLPCYDRYSGNLFYGRCVSWQDSEVLLDGIDILFSMEESCFADHIQLTQGGNSALAQIEVFTQEDGFLRKIGNYLPETGTVIGTRQLCIPVGYRCDNLILRLHGCCRPVCIEKLDIWASWELENTIWPLPTSASFTGGKLLLEALTSVAAAGEDAVFAARYLCEKLQDKTGHSLTVSEAGGQIRLLTETMDSESYRLEVTQTGCILRAPDRLHLLYAVDALLQITDETGIKCCTVEHTDFLQLRGCHFALPEKKELDFLKDMVRHVYVPMHYNTVYLQISGAMRYDNYPEINEAWAECNARYERKEWPKPPHYKYVGKDIWEKEEVRALCDYFESFGLEVIPEVQSWAHTQYITMAYPDMAEKQAPKSAGRLDLNTEDVMPDSFYHHTMCPSHPRYYEVTFGILEEVLQVVKPKRFVHMGHDEIYAIGECSACRHKTRGELYAGEVNKLNDYLKAKGLQMMIWADMLQNMSYSAPTAINQIPRDIIMLDFVWYFHLDEDIEDNLLSHGFPVILGNMYSSHYPRYESRCKKPGILGAEVSTWVECSEESYAFEGKIYDFVYSAELMCDPGYRPELRLSYNEVVKPILSRLRRIIGKLPRTPGQPLPIPVERTQIPFDIRDIVPYAGATALGSGTPSLEVAVEDNITALTFVHATDRHGRRVMWQDPVKLADYTLLYADGSSFTQSICYGSHIYYYRRTYGDRMTSSMFRHEGYVGTYLAIPECGKTHEGEDYTLYRYTLKNPHPHRKVTAVRLTHCGNTDTRILLFGIEKQG